MNLSDLLQSFDRYGRVARLYPALLTMASVVWTGAALAPGLIAISVMQAVISAAVVLGGTTLLMNIARWRGKTVERTLLADWGGWPTTRLLRHNDPTIDPYTKARYHRRLAALCEDLVMPSAAQESSDCDAADGIYRSATKRLIELRRGPELRMLHSENAAYGFRRNLLGLKPIGVTITILMILVALLFCFGGFKGPLTWVAFLQGAGSNWRCYVALTADMVYLGFWVFVVRPVFVRQASIEYAEALFRTLE